MSDDGSNSEFQNDELDRVIRAALVVDADPRRVERLEQYWRVESRKDRWQRRGYFAMAAAAAALVLIGLLIVAKDGDDDAKMASVTPQSVEDAVAVAEPSPGPSLGGRGDGEMAGRTPTEYERIMFIARTGKSTPWTAESEIDERINRPGDDLEEVLAKIEATGGVDGLLRAAGRTTEPELPMAAMKRLLEIGSHEALVGYLSLVGDGSTRPDALVAAESMEQLPLAAFLAFLDHDQKSVRLAAAMLLGHVNGPEVTEALIARVTEKPAGTTEAWMALLACRGEMAEEFMAYASRRPQLLGYLNGARVKLVYGIP